MSIVVNGMNYSYNYTDLIYEIYSDMGEGLLSKDGSMYILRDQKDDRIPGYHIIRDYYYPDCERAFAPEPYDTEEDIEEKRVYREQYLKDKPYLEEITVVECLKELNRVCEIL